VLPLVNRRTVVQFWWQY